MKRPLVLCVSLLFLSLNVYCQPLLQTTAEKSDFSSTSDYGDVMNFINILKDSSPFIRVDNIATSAEGREVPLIIIGNPLPVTPEDLKADKRIVIYIQANIHAGEVEGKEASLMFARDLLKEKSPIILNDVVLLICPIFNPDGNEKINKLNRTNQNGPVNGVGVRYNGQYLDLNRDAMKAESPEVRGVLKNVFNKWDPSVFMDCHTTNGSYHVEPVTFTWMANPNGDRSLINYMRDKMMPEISENLKGTYKIENCFYGEFYDLADPEKGWVYDASEPRYMSNYFGIRNRLGILNENYVYADFKSRVYGCYYLIKSLVDYTSVNKSEIKHLLSTVDNMTVARGLNPSVTDSFAIEYSVKPTPEPAAVRTYEVDVISDENGRKKYKKSDRQRDVKVPYYIDYFPVVNVKYPYAYIISINDPSINNLLKLHGIKVEKFKNDSDIEVERFDIDELISAERLNQGHHTNTIRGKYLKEIIHFPAGTIVVRTSQPLANVASYLLEPQSNDGIMTWNFLDRYLVPQWGRSFNAYPVYKVMDKTDLVTEEM